MLGEEEEGMEPQGVGEGLVYQRVMEKKELQVVGVGVEPCHQQLKGMNLLEGVG